MLGLRAMGRVLASGAIGFGGAALVNCGYDWGYWTTDKLIGQPSPFASNQGWMAMESLLFCIFPVMAFWALGYLTRKQARVIGPAILALLAMGALYFKLELAADEAIGGLTIALCSGILSLFCSRWLYRHLDKRLNAAAI